MLSQEAIELNNRHKKLSKELINCITKEMAIQRELNLIEYKLDLVKAYEDMYEKQKSELYKIKEDK